MVRPLAGVSGHPHADSWAGPGGGPARLPKPHEAGAPARVSPRPQALSGLPDRAIPGLDTGVVPAAWPLGCAAFTLGGHHPCSTPLRPRALGATPILSRV